MMLRKDTFFINHPVFLKVKRQFNWRTLRREEYVKWAFINERIVEIPFVIAALAQLADLPSQARVLDLGCAESVMPMYLAGMGLKVTGVDFRSYPYQVPGVSIEQADILALPMADATFDACTCVSTMEHIGIGHYDDPRDDQGADFKAMAQVRRVLKPGGMLALTVPFGVAFQGPLQRVYDSARVSKLVTGFDVLKKQFFVSDRPSAAVNNFWKPVTEAQAGQVHSRERTECVCLIKARNTGQ